MSRVRDTFVAIEPGIDSRYKKKIPKQFCLCMTRKSFTLSSTFLMECLLPYCLLTDQFGYSQCTTLPFVCHNGILVDFVTSMDFGLNVFEDGRQLSCEVCFSSKVLLQGCPVQFCQIYKEIHKAGKENESGKKTIKRTNAGCCHCTISIALS